MSIAVVKDTIDKSLYCTRRVVKHLYLLCSPRKFGHNTTVVRRILSTRASLYMALLHQPYMTRYVILPIHDFSLNI